MIFRSKTLWKANLLFFGGMMAIIMAYFYWQMYDAKKKFQKHTMEDIQTLARVIRVNAQNALSSQHVIEEILEIFLENISVFIAYLDKIEPLSSTELSHLAEENGLSGIRIKRNGSPGMTEGPEGWLENVSLQSISCNKKSTPLTHVKNRKMIVAAFPLPDNAEGCMILGLSSERIESLSDQIGLPRLLSNLSDLPGVGYAYLSPVGQDSPNESGITLLEKQGRKIAETRLSINGRTIVLGLDAGNMFFPVMHIRRESLFFAGLVISSGLLLSFGLYRYQCSHFEQVGHLERQLADEREDAALGRASAVIAHEVRNPLNAMSMGLQRLTLEAFELSSDHRLLIDSLQKSIERTNAIVSDLQRYAAPMVPEPEPLSLPEVVRAIVSLYKKAINEQNICLDILHQPMPPVMADRKLIEQAFENMIKNSVEAQPSGGFIRITFSETQHDASLSITNAGFEWPDNKKEEIVSPYVTTKSHGSGLGLSITRRIIHAHNGRFDLSVPKHGCLCVMFSLPLAVKDLEKVI